MLEVFLYEKFIKTLVESRNKSVDEFAYNSFFHLLE